jgi:hypothetical protein
MTTWTKVHFLAIAKMLNNEFRYHQRDLKALCVIDDLAEGFDRFFKTANPSFDSEKWFQYIYTIKCDYCKHECTNLSVKVTCEYCYHYHPRD